MVLYRKYRPQRIADLDSIRVRDRLAHVLSGESIPHAFLLVGPKGTGKTSTARIVAKIINCEKLEGRNSKLEGKKAIEPCNACDTCISITNGSNLDVLEIDAASNRGIDEIRSLREKIKLSPVSSRAKVYIIDEVHMLTTEAFNALLKTLEEPPAHAYFLLATTEPQKLPETITSRCFAVQFYKATSEEIVHALRRVADGEKITVTDEALAAIAAGADGAFRDAVKLFEEIAAGKKTVSTVDVAAFIGVGTKDEEILITLLSEKKTKEALALVSSLADSGINMRLFIQGMLGRLHTHLLSFYTKEKPTVSLSSAETVILLKRLSQAGTELRDTPIPGLPLELAIVEWGEKDKNQEIKPSSSPLSPLTQNFKEQLINAMKKHNHSIAGLLRSCKELTVADNTVIITVAYQFHFDRLSEPKTLEALATVASELLGKSVKVKVAYV